MTEYPLARRPAGGTDPADEPITARTVGQFMLAADLADEMEIPRYTFYSIIRRGRKIKAQRYEGRLMIHKREAERFRADYQATRRRSRRTPDIFDTEGTTP